MLFARIKAVLFYFLTIQEDKRAGLVYRLRLTPAAVLGCDVVRVFSFTIVWEDKRFLILLSTSFE